MWEILTGLEDDLKEDPRSRLVKGPQALRPPIKNSKNGIEGLEIEGSYKPK